MRIAGFVAAILAGGSGAWAQVNIDVVNRVGPNGTRFNLELPVSSYLYECDTTCNYSYNHQFKVYHNGVLKYSDTFDVINPSGSTYYSNNVSFSGWNLQVGDVVRFFSYVKIISGPFTGQKDTDNLYGDVVDLISCGPRLPERRSVPVHAIDDTLRFEEFLG